MNNWSFKLDSEAALAREPLEIHVRLEARETVGNHLPADVSEPVRDRVIKMTETISGNVAF